MTKNVLVGVNNVAKKPKNIYVGVDGKARRVKAAYVGVNGIAKQVWPAGVLPNTHTQLEYLDSAMCIRNIGVQPVTNPRVIIEFSVNGSLEYNGVQSYINADQTIDGDSTSYVYYGFSISNSAGSSNGFSFTYSKTINYEQTYSKYFNSNETEGILSDTTYRVDFLNGNNVYLYNTEGYYSIASHNLLGSFTKQSISNPSSEYRFMLFGQARNYRKGFGKIFYAQVYNGSTLIRNLYPCYENRNKYLGYYDIVNRLFYEVSYDSMYDRSITYDEAIQQGYLVGSIV